MMHLVVLHAVDDVVLRADDVGARGTKRVRGG